MRRVLLVLATALVMCGVKGPPRPPAKEIPDAGVSDGGTP